MKKKKPELRDEWPVTVRLLHSPHMRDQALSFRRPKGADIKRCGNPLKIDREGDVIIQERNMSRMIAALSGFTTAKVERLDARDWSSCAYRLRLFFLPELKAWE